MKRVHYLLLAVCCLILSGLFLACGSGPGSPGSTGSEKTGVTLDASIAPANTIDVDAFQGLCCSGAEISPGGSCSSTPTVEPFTDHAATVTITATLLNPNAQFAPGKLFVEEYTVEFRRSTDSIGAPPIEQIIDGTVGMPVVIAPPTGTGTTTVTTTVTLVDLIRKIKYASDINSGIFNSRDLNNYTAIFTFKGKNDFGDAFTFQAETGFEMGDFNNCGATGG